MKCIQCGAELPEGTRFCAQCGAPQTPAPTQNAAPAQPPQGYVPPQPQTGSPAQPPQQPQNYAAPQGYAPQQPGYPQQPTQPNGPTQGYAAQPPAQQEYIPPQQPAPQQNSAPQQQGYAPQAQPVQPQGYTPPQPNGYAPQQQNYAAPQQGYVPQQPVNPAPQPDANRKKKKTPTLPIILGVAAVAVVAALLIVLLPRFIKPKPGPVVENTTPPAETSEADPTMPTLAPTPLPEGYQSPDVGEADTDIALYTYFSVDQGLNEPTGDKVFEAPDLDGWGDFYTIQLDELTLHTSSGETPFTISMESVCSSSYAFLSENRYYGDGLDVEAHMCAKAGDRYLFRMKNTDGEDWGYHIYDKAADTLAFLGYYSQMEACGNYLLLRPCSAAGGEAPLFVFDWAGEWIHTYESVYDWETDDGALYLLYGFESLSLDRIPLDRFKSTQLDAEPEHLADYPDFTGQFARTQGGKLQVSLVRSDRSDVRTFDLSDAVSVADALRQDPAPAAAPVKASCRWFTVGIPAFFEGRVEIEEEENGVFLYVPDGGSPVLLYGLKLISEAEYDTLAYNSCVVEEITLNGETFYLTEVNPPEMGAFPFESSALWEALRSCVGEISGSVQYKDPDAGLTYPFYHDIPVRYGSASGEYRFRILSVDNFDLRCTFCRMGDALGPVEKAALDVKMVGGRGLLFDGSYQVGELLLKDGNVIVTIDHAPSPALNVTDLVLSPME